MSKKTHHVVPSQNGGWNVKKGGTEKPAGHFATKAEAIDAVREISRNQGTEFVIHGKDGQILHASPVRSTLRENKVRQVIRSVSNSNAGYKDNRTSSEK